MRDRTTICIFEGIMDAVDILQKTLLSFVHEVFPDGHRFMQDNDPKHNSKMGKDVLATNNIKWCQRLPESPDLNPIKNLWHELRVFATGSKAQDKEELISRIELLWGSVNEKSRKCMTFT